MWPSGGGLRFSSGGLKLLCGAGKGMALEEIGPGVNPHPLLLAGTTEHCLGLVLGEGSSTPTGVRSWGFSANLNLLKKKFV